MLSSLLIPAVLFFALGFLAKLIKSDLRFPSDLAKALSIYLLMAIGLHGGYELGKADLLTAMNSVMWALVLGFGMPLIGYAILVFQESRRDERRGHRRALRIGERGHFSDRGGVSR